MSEAQYTPAFCIFVAIAVRYFCSSSKVGTISPTSVNRSPIVIRRLVGLANQHLQVFHGIGDGESTENICDDLRFFKGEVF